MPLNDAMKVHHVPFNEMKLTHLLSLVSFPLLLQPKANPDINILPAISSVCMNVIQQPFLWPCPPD